MIDPNKMCDICRKVLSAYTKVPLKEGAPSSMRLEFHYWDLPSIELWVFPEGPGEKVYSYRINFWKKEQEVKEETNNLLEALEDIKNNITKSTEV
jgi:hypothetical protein